MNTKSATCPQCGAIGTIGGFCEYCGAKIPMPVTKVNQDDDSTPFSWYNVVIPQGYIISEDNVIGDPKYSLFMVVEAERGDEKFYGLINRKGKFVIDCNNRSVDLFADTNYCCITSSHYSDKLINLQNKEIVYNSCDASSSCSYLDDSLSVAKIKDFEKRTVSLYDTKNENYISIPAEISSIDADSWDYGAYWSYDERTELLSISKIKYNIGKYKRIETKWLAKICDGALVVIDKKEEREEAEKNEENTEDFSCLSFLLRVFLMLVFGAILFILVFHFIFYR